ncbi:MAG: radical SAM protein [Bacteroidales bacterium]|nr:radical SAM protein [Bacteroidales bacterium]
MKITLILAAHRQDPLLKRDPFMPLSLPILASVAPEHDYTLIDMLWEPEKVNYDTDSEIIGISMRQSAEATAFELADEFTKRGKTVILGGAQASAMPLRAKEHARTVVVGEAEELWPILLKDYENKELKDFYVCSPVPFTAENHTIYQQKEMPNLSNLPTPHRHLFKRKYTFDLTFASRGCPIACDFCMVSDIFGTKLRFKPIDDVVNDIKNFKNFYYILDDTVFGRANCYDYYIELYSKIAEIPNKKYWHGQANLDAASTEKGREVIKMAAKSGLIYAAVGLESVNTTTLKSSGAYNKMGINSKSDPLKQMKDNIAFIQSQGIIISGWFAIGYETDSLQTYYDTLAFCKETNIIPVFTPIRALPGSRLWNKMVAEGLVNSDPSALSNIEHPQLSPDMVLKGMNETAKKGFSASAHWERLKFYYKTFKKSEKNLNDVIYKLIFAQITQRKMGKIVKEENNHIAKEIGTNF